MLQKLSQSDTRTFAGLLLSNCGSTAPGINNCWRFSADEMLALVEDKFGSWASQGVELTRTPVIVDQSNYDRIILVNKPDATQVDYENGYKYARP